MMLSGDAWTAALCEDGPGLVADICERAYGAGHDLVDLDGIRATVASGKGAEMLAALPQIEPYDPAKLHAAIDGMVTALGGVPHPWPAL